MKIVLVALLAAAATPQQFDLTCTGQGGTDGTSSIAWAPTEVHFRIDLATRRWCEADCKIIREIAEVQPASIWLEKQSPYEKAREIVHFRAINRETGQYTRIEESRYGSTAERGRCQPAPFSGFPEIRTKF